MKRPRMPKLFSFLLAATTGTLVGFVVGLNACVPLESTTRDADAPHETVVDGVPSVDGLP